MSQPMQTNQATMDTGARHVDDVNQQVQGELKSLQGKLESMQGQWHGMAKTAFDNLMLRYNDDANKLSQALQSISDNIRANGVQYNQADEQAAHALNHAGSSLNI